MERAPKGSSLARALDAMRGALAPQDALQLLMMLVPLRHKADAERVDEKGDHTGALPAWDALLARDLWNRSGHEVMSEALRGLEAWGSRHFRLPDLPPALVDVRGPQLAPLIECVAAAPDPAALFEECMEQAQTTAKGGDYYTPLDIARLLTALMEPQAGEAVYDPVCGSGGFLLRAREFVEAHGGAAGEPALYGQDASRTALQTAAMNFTVHGVEGVYLQGPSSTLTDDRFPDLMFDVVVANPPFNQFGWDEGGHGRYNRPWRYGIPPAGNANFAWVQHVVSKMMPSGRGRGVLLLPTGAAATSKPAERQIRARLVEDDVLSCVIELPAGLLPHVRNPVSLWLFTRSKKPRQGWGHEDRSGRILLIDARDTAAKVGRGRRALPDGARSRIISTFAAWRGAPGQALYEDVPGWCRSLSTQEIAAHDHDVLPSHHVGLPAAESAHGDGEELVADLTHELYSLFETSRHLEAELRDLLGRW
ncbi:N-6 DNA methylase [Streptomyces sp. SLBN-8D4]|uniref:N-6 DNA methylase n=1 Tax=Streptomyces sp. SLBN-8D4 TaxID=3377728 RepID=UPI003C79B078